MHPKQTVIHVTDEAAAPRGGVGVALQGLLTTEAYQDCINRSIVIGPLSGVPRRAGELFGEEGEILYCAGAGIFHQPYARALLPVERKFRTPIIYGRRVLEHANTKRKVSTEVILIDVSRADLHPVNAFKAWLWEDFGVESLPYENDAEYDQYVKLGPVAVAALRELGVAEAQRPALVVGHGHGAMPTVLAAMMDPLGLFKTVFYAHEVAPLRRLVEEHPGHDTMFLNMLDWALAHEYYLHEVFGPQRTYESSLVRAAAHCENIVAASDRTRRELRFLDPACGATPCEVVYEGLPAEEISLGEKQASKKKLQQYARNLLGYEPDHVCTHVGRMSRAKAFWRDLTVLHYLEDHLRRAGQSAVCFVLSTDAPARTPEEVRYMEEKYGWPVGHRVGVPDLTAAEAEFHGNVCHFNAHHQHVKVVFVNQFGWEQALCGRRMPEEMSLSDLRRGSDLEFGPSIYEAFGRASFEPLTYGALCLTSSACGGNDFVQALTGEKLPDNLLVADYRNGQVDPANPKSILAVDQMQRDELEHRRGREMAGEIARRWPRNDLQAEGLLIAGYELARRMSWEHVCREYLLPALNRTYQRHVRRTA